MLTYSPDAERINPPASAEKPWLLILLCLIWLLPGLVGHDPWKPRELETAAVIGRFLAGQHWAIPWFADAAYLDNTPLYYWVATLFAWPLSKLGMSVHDAARITTGLWCALAFWGIGLAGRELYGRRNGRVTVMAMVGCIGLIIWGHHLATPILLLTGFCWQAYALALARRRPLLAGWVLAGAWLVLFLGTSLSEFALGVLTALLLAMFKPWRRGAYLATVLTALVIVLPVGGMWLADFAHTSPTLFALWLHQDAFGPFGGWGHVQFFRSPTYFFSAVPWFAWPALPLALWGGWVMRRDLRSAAFVMPALMIALNTLFLICASDNEEAHLLLMLPALALLSTAGVDSLRHGAAAALNWFGVLTLGLLTGALWLGWLVLHLGLPGSWSTELQMASPAYTANLHIPGFAFAGIVSAIWIWVLSRKRPLGRRALTNWVCGVTLLWGVLIGLWQPWLDASKSYRSVSLSLAHALQGRNGCLGGDRVSDKMAASLDYFAGIPLQRSNATACPWLLTQEQVPAGSVTIWQGSRPGERRELFSLYANPAVATR
ncbi:4-amino-4-deoxy-L-arabinose transferase [Andreprevotia lacus DSM 23236]|jgi:4-amino-4-deoxy-L-arabinose transferase-like glycosyltransferase|uniref:4-amino-4-deoxy-L-arabinose transferase n=1 Tax=Andreprevotia lacus DSM 23236 TaxID=1121001 RepID=A0A1W1WYU8_9NEIS|nr:glycosyltransferase family 39 protein [Andreprevotia lacus]SMC16892.1 4-amino-4-deoxy-L-arabinose transferase [Andreprevotia lacus DSM 23236]